MLNYGMYGIPNVGAQLCDFDPIAQFDQLLCGLYLKLAVISPLAVYSDRLPTLENHLFQHNASYIYYSQLLI